MNIDHLPNQRENEHIVLFLRRQWFTLLRIVVAFLILTIFPIVLAFYFWDTLSVWIDGPFLGPVIVVGASLFYLCTWLFAFVEFTDYYLDIWIVTTERIINIEQKGLFNRTAAELDLVSVQDATAEVRGFLETIFEFGDVLIETAGEVERFHFINVNHPEKIKETVMKLTLEAKERLSAHNILTPAAPPETKTPSI